MHRRAPPPVSRRFATERRAIAAARSTASPVEEEEMEGRLTGNRLAPSPASDRGSRCETATNCRPRPHIWRLIGATHPGGSDRRPPAIPLLRTPGCMVRSEEPPDQGATAPRRRTPGWRREASSGLRSRFPCTTPCPRATTSAATFDHLSDHADLGDDPGIGLVALDVDRSGDHAHCVVIAHRAIPAKK